MAEFRFFHLNPKGNLVPVETLEKTLELRKTGGGYVWIDLFEPSQEAIAPLIEPFELHALEVEDCLDDDQIPKMEVYPENIFLLCNALSYSSGVLQIDEVDFILGKDFLLSVHGFKSAGRRHFDRIDERINRNLILVRRGPDFLLQLLLDHLVDRKFPILEAIQDQLDTSEDNLLKDIATFRPDQIMDLRRCLMSLRKSLFHEREILIRICRKDISLITDKSMPHYRDVYDHLTKYVEMTETFRETVTSLMELFVSLSNNQMAQASNQMNLVMKRLTLITTLFMPMTLLSGIGGMSEWSMICGPDNWKISYPVFFLLMILTGAVNYWLLKAKKWID